MQGMSNAFVHRHEAALLDVICDWVEASLLELVEGGFVPQAVVPFRPACHVQVAANNVHLAAGIETQCFVNCFANLVGARLRFFLRGCC